MDSSSTSSAHKSFKYDVFLSFQGEDLRKNFVDHLYASLKRQGIYTFKDDKNLQKGGKIGNQLIESIQNSKFFIIVFSQDYASSSWCLKELVKIIECVKNNTMQIAYPVFYDVDPSEVRKQQKSYGKALAEHNKKADIGKEDIEKWRDALKEAGNLVGYDVRNMVDGHEAEVIKQIVAEISKKLCSSYLSNDEKLVGMDTRMHDVLSSLEIGLNDVRMTGIKGMGGAGKTTLARALFEMISVHYEFEGVSFVHNVRENSTSVSGLQSLQEKVLKDVLKDRDIIVSNIFDGKLMIKNRLCGVKALVVLDDVDDISQLEALAGALNWFKSGSRIIITTRNDQVLVSHGVKTKHDINLLSNEEAICLFNMYACKGDMPSERYEKLSQEVVDYAAGLPLTVKVLGSLLCGQGESLWIDLLRRLEKIPLKETLVVLEVSYNSLEDDQKEIFLDVACLLRHRSKKVVIRMLESCGFRATYGLTVLEQRSFITFSQSRLPYDDNEYLDMHDHIQEMGRNIVRRDQPDDPSKHSRLWITKEIKDVLVNGLGTEATRCIYIEGFVDLDPEIIMKGLGRMKNLRVLMLKTHSHSYFFPTEWKFDDVGQYFPNALPYLNWEGYPFFSLPKSFQANNLVALDMPYSKIQQLWEGEERKVLDNLKFLNLSYSMLTKLDLGLTPNLEVLELKYCRYLSELHVPGGCPVLRSLNLNDSKLTKLDLGPTPNLETLYLFNCDKLVEFDMSSACPKLRSLNLMTCSKLTKLELGSTPNLEKLDLLECVKLIELDMSGACQKLRFLNLSHLKLTKLDLGPTPNLETLDLIECFELVDIDMSAPCRKLRSLKLMRCSMLTKLDLGQTPNLETLYLDRCYRLIELDMSTAWPKLRFLKMNHLVLTKIELGHTPNLERLDLDGCNELVEVDMSAVCPKLRSLDLRISKLTKVDLGRTPNLEMLYVYGCDVLVELDMSGGCPNLRSLNLISCSKLRKLELGPTPYLVTLHLEYCIELVELDMSTGCPELRSLKIEHSKLTKLELGPTPNLEMLDLNNCFGLVGLELALAPKLKVLKLRECHDLEELHLCIGCLKELNALELSGCSSLKSLVLTKESESHLFGESLESLDIYPLDSNHVLPNISLSCSYKEQPSSFAGNLEKLIYVGSCRCSTLRSTLETIGWLPSLSDIKLGCGIPYIPNDNGKSECLEELIFSCTEIIHLPYIRWEWGCLKSLKLERCTNLEELRPEHYFVRLRCLEKLHLSYTRTKRLPSIICELKHLKYLQLVCCEFLEELPENLGQLKCLEELILQECKLIRDIPDSICKMKSLNRFHLSWCSSEKIA